MKRLLALLILSGMTATSTAPVVGAYYERQNTDIIIEDTVVEELFVIEETEYTEPIEVIDIKQKSNREVALVAYTEKIEEHSSAQNKMEWFIEYQEVLEQYKNHIEYPITIYDTLSEKDLKLLYSVVEAEVGNWGFEEKCNVISVIFNRMYDTRFKNQISDLLTSDQFATIKNGSYKTVTITKETILACEYVYMFGDTTNGAIYFEGGKSTVHNAYATYMFTDKSGHKFYK